MTAPDFVALVLAAGKGTRMKGEHPKVLHPLGGRPMVAWPVQAALEAGARRCVVVVGHGSDQVVDALRARFGERVGFVEQPEQRGTGHAVQCALPAIEAEEDRVLILYGDTPLIRAETLQALLRSASSGPGPLAMLTAELPDPTGYGRILRDDRGRVVGVREHRDASAAERRIREVNPGLYAVDAAFLRDAIRRLTGDNAQGELYLTDVVAAAAAQGDVATVERGMDELRGVNDRHELAVADRLLRLRVNRRLAEAGVTIRDPHGTFIDADSVLETDAIVEPAVHLRGRCRVAAGARIDVGSVLTDVTVEAGAYVKPYTVAERSRIGAGAQVGPFAHLRPDTDLGPDARVGNFVETKKTRMGRGSKANHLAYVGDGDIGEDVNIGAGTIFCNYDGYEKHTTVLEDGVFIGSDSQLVAPVRVGKGAYVASGTTVVDDVPADALAIARVKQKNKEGFASRLRRRLAAAKKRRRKGGETEGG
ncbi:MAG: bifunctional UDP-N-acetylglucosamine diphosphorylase/glucosamine-1-phosphate N-acetyltransferase GlmU [Myxococcota bacterium]